MINKKKTLVLEVGGLKFVQNHTTLGVSEWINKSALLSGTLCWFRRVDKVNEPTATLQLAPSTHLRLIVYCGGLGVVHAN